MVATATTKAAQMNDQPTLRSNPQGRQPVVKIDTYFPIVAAVWRNENPEGRAWYSATVERRYKDRDEKWQSTGSFGGEDLLLVQKVAGLAHSEIYRLQNADRDAGREPGRDG